MRRDALMCMFYKSHSIYKIVFWIVVLVLFMSLKPVTAFSKKSPPSIIRSGTVTINGKTADAILVSERRFMVTESTTILTVKGRKIQLSALPVPCKAEIEYQLRMDEHPVTLKIRVKRLLKGASESWPPPDSER